MSNNAATPENPRTSARSRVPPALVCLAGLALMALAVPWVKASLLQVPTDKVKRVMLSGNDPAPAALQGFISSRRAAFAWVQNSEIWFDIGLARLKSAGRAGYRTEDGRRALDQAEAAYDRGLARSPGNAAAWMRLGEVRLMRGGRPRKAAEALHMAIRIAPFAPWLLIERLRLAAMAWPYMDAAGREAVERQVGMAFRHRWLAPHLARIAKRPEVRDVLAPMIERIEAQGAGGTERRRVSGS